MAHLTWRRKHNITKHVKQGKVQIFSNQHKVGGSMEGCCGVRPLDLTMLSWSGGSLPAVRDFLWLQLGDSDENKSSCSSPVSLYFNSYFTMWACGHTQVVCPTVRIVDRHKKNENKTKTPAEKEKNK